MNMNSRELRTAALQAAVRGAESIDETQIQKAIDAIIASKRVFVAGAGRTLLFLKALGMNLMQIGKLSYAVGEIATPSIRKGDVLICASWSGTTRVTNIFVQQAKKEGATIIAFTAHKDSPLGEAADILIEITAEMDPEVVKEHEMYNGYTFDHIVVPLYDCLVASIRQQAGIPGDIMHYNHANME